jgi:hypothetical protein
MADAATNVNQQKVVLNFDHDEEEISANGFFVADVSSMIGSTGEFCGIVVGVPDIPIPV